jgi:hypothetical protein
MYPHGAEVERCRQQGCPGWSFAEQPYCQEYNDSAERADDRNEIQTNRRYTPKHCSGHITQPHRTRRSPLDRTVDDRNRREIR